MPSKRPEKLAALAAGIYEAAVDPADWPAACNRIAAAFRAPGVMLTGTDFSLLTFPHTISAELASGYLELMEQHPDASNPLILGARKMRVRPGVAVTYGMLADLHELRRSTMYQTVFRRYGVEHGCVLFLQEFPQSQPMQTAYNHFALSRSTAEGDFSDADCRELASLWPHFRRAAEIQRRLGAERHLARAALESLDWLPTGMLLIGANGAVLHANAAAEQMLRCNDGIALRHGRLGCADPRVTSRLHGLIAEAVHAFGLDLPASGGAMLLPRPSGLPSWQVIVSPLAPGNPYASGPAHVAALVMVSDPSATMHVPQARLAALFGLTGAESRVALGLANGLSPAEIADRQQASLFTVRTHIRRLHEKLGARSQGQLIRRVLFASGADLEPRQH